MKAGIHPKFHTVMVHCACGETFVTRSTRDELRLEICSKCHPFFTGKQKLIDSAGRVERFEKRYKKTQEVASRIAAAKAAGKAAAAAPAAEKAPSGKAAKAGRAAKAGKGKGEPAPTSPAS